MWFFGLIVVLLIGAVAVVASGRWGAMSPAYDDRPDMTVPKGQLLTSDDVESVRFGVGLRGYRMDEVDTFLTRLGREVADRDRRIADLERAVAPIVETPDGAGFGSRPAYDAGDFEDTGTQAPILVGGDFPKPATPEPPTPSASVTPTDSSTPAGPAAPATSEAPAAQAVPGTSTAPAESASEEQPDAAEPPAVQAAADEYERLQAEARAVLESQSQPGPPRRTSNQSTQPKNQPAPEADADEQAGEDAYPRPK